MTLASSISSAAGGPAARFKTLARVIPAMLLRPGPDGRPQYSRFGALDLQQFIREISPIKVAIQNEEEIARRNGDGRKTARWEHTPAGPVITYDPYSMKRFDVAAIEPLLALHDFLGMLGHNDHDYVASLGMFFLARPSTTKLLLPEERAQVEAIISRQLYKRTAGGGVIGVGGGGQFATLLYRSLLMAKCSLLMEKARTPRDRAEIMKALIQLWMEPDEVTYEGGANPRIDFSLPPGR